MLAVLALVAHAAALWSFRVGLESSTSRHSERRLNLESFRFPGKLGGLIAKDFRYYRRLLDVYLVLLGAAVGCIYLVTSEVPTRGIFLAGLCLVFLLSAAVALNSFGLDSRTGIDRYSLLPLPGTLIILSKNLAYVTMLAILALPMIALAGWRLGISTAALGIVEAAALACGYLTWGNWMSVSHPLKIQFFRFASSGAALADAMAGLVFGSLPGILIIYLLHTRSEQVYLKIAVVVFLFAALYCASVVRFGGRFDQKREMIARVLS
jgi:hypothetical protein